jgi:hypothetical protein
LSSRRRIEIKRAALMGYLLGLDTSLRSYPSIRTATQGDARPALERYSGTRGQGNDQQEAAQFEGGRQKAGLQDTQDWDQDH